MERKDYLVGEIRKCRRKMNLAKLIDLGILWAAAGGGAGVLCEIISLFQPFYYADLAAFLCFVAGLMAGLVRAVIGRADMRQAAGRLDSFGLKERMLTAYENRDRADEFAVLLREDAASCYDRIRGQIKLSLLPDKRHILALFLAVLAVAGLALIPSPVREQAKLRHQVQEQAKEERETLEELAEALEGVDSESLTAEQREKLQELLDGMELSKEELGKADSRESLSAAMQRLDYKYRQAAADLEALAAQMEHPEAAGIASAQALAKAAAEQNGGQMASTGTEAAASGQENDTGDGQDGGESGQTGDGNGSGPGSEQGGDGNSPGSGQSGDGDGDSRNGSGTDGNGSGPGGEQSGNGTGSGQDGDGNGAGSGQNGNGNGTGSGRGTGSSDAAHDYVSIPGEVAEDPSLIGNKTGDENSDYFRGYNGLAWEGEHVDYSSVIGEYTDSAYEGIANGRYPSGMEPVIRDYFEQLNKSE